MTGITIIRINVLLHVDFTDLSFSMHDAAFWSVAEPAIAIINSCIATLRPLLRMISPRSLWSSNKGSSGGRAGYSGNILSNRGPSNNKSKLGLDHDEYPLTRVEGGITVTTVIGTEEERDFGSADSNSYSSTKRTVHIKA